MPLHWSLRVIQAPDYRRNADSEAGSRGPISVNLTKVCEIVILRSHYVVKASKFYFSSRKWCQISTSEPRMSGSERSVSVISHKAHDPYSHEIHACKYSLLQKRFFFSLHEKQVKELDYPCFTAFFLWFMYNSGGVSPSDRNSTPLLSIYSYTEFYDKAHY